MHWAIATTGQQRLHGYRADTGRVGIKNIQCSPWGTGVPWPEGDKKPEPLGLPQAIADSGSLCVCVVGAEVAEISPMRPPKVANSTTSLTPQEEGGNKETGWQRDVRLQGSCFLHLKNPEKSESTGPQWAHLQAIQPGDPEYVPPPVWQGGRQPSLALEICWLKDLIRLRPQMLCL